MAVELVPYDDFAARAFAVRLYIEAVIGETATKKLFISALASGKAKLEADCETFWEQKVIRQSPPAEGDVYDVLEPGLDYYRGQFNSNDLPSWDLRRTPVVSIQGMCLSLNEVQPLITIPEEWMRLDLTRG